MHVPSTDDYNLARFTTEVHAEIFKGVQIPLRFTTILVNSLEDTTIFPSWHRGHLQGKLNGIHPVAEGNSNYI